MKKAILFILLLLPFLAKTQNWDLFPYGQKSFYGFKREGDAFYTFIDSIKTSGDTSVYLPFTHSLLPDTVICREFLDSIAIASSPYSFLRSWMRIGNTLYFSEHPETDNPVYFRLDSLPGSSWPVYTTLTGTDIDHFWIDYDSIGYGMVAGQMDSLRYYSIHIDTVWPGDFNLDDMFFILSKDYGMVHYPDPYELNHMRNLYYMSYFYSDAYLIGCIKDEDTTGAVIPKFSDWIGLHPGDVLKFKNTNSWSTTPTYFIRTVMSVDRDEERVTINFEEGAAYSQTFYKKVLDTPISYFGNGYIFCPGWPMDTTVYFPGADEYYSIANRIMRFDTVCGTDCYSLSVELNPAFGLTPDCEISEIMCGPSPFKFDLYRGLIGYGEGCWDDYYDNQLIGSVISGYGTGDYWPVTIEQQYGSETGLNIYPNPAGAQIKIQSPFAETAEYFICDMTGKIWNTTRSMDNSINISGLPSGAYLIRENSIAGVRTGQFIKL